MLVEKMNDLAFRFVEDNIVMNHRSLYNYFIENEGTKPEFDYFLVFIKHWLDNKRVLEWTDIIMDSTYDRDRNSFCNSSS